jgi:hypothetical protein
MREAQEWYQREEGFILYVQCPVFCGTLHPFVGLYPIVGRLCHSALC